MSIIASVILAATIPATTNIAEQVAIMWTAHTNRIAAVERAKLRRKESAGSVVERVREYAKKRKSALGKNSGGVRK